MPASALPGKLAASPLPSSPQLLVFAHTPPPIHGQSLMVQTLVEGLAAFSPGLRLWHSNPRLSRDAADVGRWRAGKLGALLAACARALLLRCRHGPMIFYYVPAPARRAALYRDWAVMLLCRPFFPTLVLHWHAVGLGEWLERGATPPERWITRLLLGRADLAIVLAPELAADARLLGPQRISVVANGLEFDGEPVRDSGPAHPPATPTEVLFVGLCTRDKGLFDTLSAVAIANRRIPGAFRLTVAGAFASTDDERAFHSQAAELGGAMVRHAGFVNPADRSALFTAAHVFCLPTAYAHEGQPLALIEALAADLPIITTRWRAIPGMLPAGHVWLVDSHRPDQIAEALLAARTAGAPGGRLRAHYRAHFGRDQHLRNLAAALASVGG